MQFIAIILFIAIAVYALYFFARQKRGLQAAAEQPLNTSLLNAHVLFYKNLDAAGKKAFEEDVRYFLSHTRITGVDTTVAELDKLLIAAAAVIPIFHFKHWRYCNLKEVLLYSDSINHQFESKGRANRNILGMVGDGVYNGSLLLSKHALRQGFANKTDKQNTAIHEFVHLIDKADGDTDGLPELLLDKQYVLPWLNLMHENMQQMARGTRISTSMDTRIRLNFLQWLRSIFLNGPNCWLKSIRNCTGCWLKCLS